MSSKKKGPRRNVVTDIGAGDGYARLGLGVLANATGDVPGLRFLATPSADLDFWCAVAGLSAEQVRDAAQARGQVRL